MSTKTNLYSDIDFTFTKKPVSGDVALSYDEAAVVRSVRNLLLTNEFERPFDPTLGSNISALLFEPDSPFTASSLVAEIENTIQNYEPRVTIDSLVVTPNPDNNAYNVELVFYIENATLPTVVTLLLERNR